MHTLANQQASQAFSVALLYLARSHTDYLLKRLQASRHTGYIIRHESPAAYFSHRRKYLNPSPTKKQKSSPSRNSRYSMQQAYLAFSSSAKVFSVYHVYSLASSAAASLCGLFIASTAAWCARRAAAKSALLTNPFS